MKISIFKKLESIFRQKDPNNLRLNDKEKYYAKELKKILNTSLGLRVHYKTTKIDNLNKLKYLKNHLAFYIFGNSNYSLPFNDYASLLKGNLNINMVRYLIHWISDKYSKRYGTHIVCISSPPLYKEEYFEALHSKSKEDFESMVISSKELQGLKNKLLNLPNTTDILFLPLAIRKNNHVLITCDFPQFKTIVFTETSEGNTAGLIRYIQHMFYLLTSSENRYRGLINTKMPMESLLPRNSTSGILAVKHMHDYLEGRSIQVSKTAGRNAQVQKVIVYKMKLAYALLKEEMLLDTDDKPCSFCKVVPEDKKQCGSCLRVFCKNDQTSCATLSNVRPGKRCQICSLDLDVKQKK